MKLLIFTIVTFGILFFVTGFLLKDFMRFMRKMTKDIFISSGESKYYLGEVLLTLFSALILSAIVLVFMKGAMAFCAWIFSDDLTGFFIALRGVYTSSIKAQHPMQWQHLILGLLITPIIQFGSAFLIFRGIRTFFTFINKKYEGNVFSETDAFYFGFIAAVFLVLGDIFLFSQYAKNSTNNLLHYLFLAISSLPPLFYYLTICHLNMLHSKEYKNSLVKYVQMSPKESRIVNSPWRLISFAYLMGILLTTSFHFGLFPQLSDWQIILLVVFVCTVTSLLLHFVFSKGWNYLATVLLHNSVQTEEIVDNLYKIPEKKQRTALITLSLLFLIFIFLKWNLSLFMIAIIIVPTLLATIGLILSYSIGLLIGNFHAIFTEGSVYVFKANIVKRYFKNISTSIVRSLLPSLVFMLLVFNMLSVFPKKFIYKNEYITKSVIDREGAILYLENNTNHCIPTDYNSIPDFTLKCLYYQEDKGFSTQSKLILFNKSYYSNWHGISFRANSNLNMQLIKNNVFNNKLFPHAISRKIAELPSAFQLSVSQNADDITTWYVNLAGFHGGYNGAVGINSASLYVFGRPIHQLNLLEQLYLVRTLPRKQGLLTNVGEVKYFNIENYQNEVKTALLKKATTWYEEGLFTKKELAGMKRDSLRFINKPYRPDIAISTRLFFQNQLVEYPDARYTTSITKTNQDKIRIAYDSYLNNRFYPPAYEKDNNRLYMSALVVNYRTGEVLGHFSNHTEDLTNFFDGYPVASLIKPFVLLQLFEEDIPINIFDGKIANKKIPKNQNREYTNTYVDEQTIIQYSLNTITNIREICNPLPIYQKIEANFEAMGIKPQNEHCEDVYNYPLGTNRSMTIWNIAQAYQTLFCDGTYMKLTAIPSVFDPQTNTEKLLQKADSKKIYNPAHANKIKSAMTKTIDGTAAPLKNILPKNQEFYIKTGTSSGNKHGYCVLADEEIMVVSWISYGKITNDKIILGQSPIPHNAGGKSAGVFSALIYKQLINNQ
ncbi:transglycosylase domain-containing protein [Porphyromonadaceae bacterium OttesenSCG-928-L07]|nr:transglycosylase domain-containing protein [Porphyromonadaceae bacterium OttesenSCG-928-L07]